MNSEEERNAVHPLMESNEEFAHSILEAKNDQATEDAGSKDVDASEGMPDAQTVEHVWRSASENLSLWMPL